MAASQRVSRLLSPERLTMKRKWTAFGASGTFATGFEWLAFAPYHISAPTASCSVVTQPDTMSWRS
jgi:hypothetical protein